MIKQILQAGLILTGMITTPSWAVMITSGLASGTSAGAIDSFIAEAAKAGNPTNETAWVNSILGTSGLSYTVKTSNVSYYKTDVTNVFALSLTAQPSYFLIKNATRMALFQNLAGVDWGVFDTSLLSSGKKSINLPSGGFTISHVTHFGGGGGNGSVPEPGVVALLGIGLLGMVTLRGLRRRLDQARAH
ncbi:MAG: PEP-CTERM sorting domain-containing protein [Gammaproteobacteria bacterium]